MLDQISSFPANDVIESLELNGSVLLFGGCYSNFEATQALLHRAVELEIPPDRMICTGDVVAYGADPAATVNLIRETGVRVVMGNCEEALGFGAPDCGCGFTEGSACDRLSVAWYSYADAQLDDEARQWMRSLPRRLDINIGGRRLAVVHGSIERINEFVFASTPEEELVRQIYEARTDGIVGGHCGLPFTRLIDGKLWHNPGAIGMPANDGTPQTWFSVIEPGQGGRLHLRHVTLTYYAASAAHKIRTVRLPEGYAAALETGMWPSCDVLPPSELTRRGRRIEPTELAWPERATATWPPRSIATKSRATNRKFLDPEVTATGERRAAVSFHALKTLWFNTGTLCNLECRDCYIESSPRNDRLAYISRSEVRATLREAAEFQKLEEIGFTGGEPFMNPEIMGLIEDALAGGWRVLVLTNAMRPMQRHKEALLRLHKNFPGRISLRVSLDHHTAKGHEQLRGWRSWDSTIQGLRWLAHHGFELSIAGRTTWLEHEAELRQGYRLLFALLGIDLDAENPHHLVLFPEMDVAADVPEITEGCWSELDKSPDSVMCATSRMVVKRKDAARTSVVSCTLLPYDEAFELGTTLAESSRPVKLNHPHCARFCVLGGASCSTAND